MQGGTEHRQLAFGASDELLGAGLIWPTDAQRFRMDLVVAEAHRRRGVGTHLLGCLLEQAARHGARTLQARAAESNAVALSFLERHGFRETLRIHHFSLKAEQVNLAPDAESRLVERGITIDSVVTELERTPDTYVRLAAVYDAASDEWPDPDPAPKRALSGDDVRAPCSNAGARFLDAVFIARAAGDYVGFTGLCVGGKSVGTAVRPAFRGLGVATALKRRLIRWAQAEQVPQLHAANAHPAMVRLHRQLGFELAGIEVRLVRRLT